MEEQVQVEWDNVNKLLQYQGFKPVCFTDPVENKNISDLVLLDRKSCGELRTTLRTMLADSDRRQALLQELVKSNNLLKGEVQDHMSRTAKQTQRASELERLLDQVKTRVQDLEDRCLGKAIKQHSNTQQLQQDKQEAQNQCRVLEQKVSKQQEEAAELHRKLHFTIKEEERRLQRQDQVCKETCARITQQRSPADQQVLEESRLQQEELRKEVQQLKQELQSRPTLKEVKFYKHKLRRLEGLGKKSEMRSAHSESISESTAGSRLWCHYHHLLSEIHDIVTVTDTHPRPKPSAEDLQALLPTLEGWAQQVHLLQDLHHSLTRLSARLMPWQPGGGGDQKVEDLVLLVDTMLEQTSPGNSKVLGIPTHYTLGSMVSHFQKLFDVTSLCGVYPRMNEVYTQLGEMTNTMRNLREVLNLDGRAAGAEMVQQVSSLVSVSETSSELRELLQDGDLHSVILKVKQHEEFFPTFHRLLTDILQTVGVSVLDDLLPALRGLTQTTAAGS